MAKISLDDLLQNVEKAKRRMSQKNQHRLLFMQCQQVMVQLATELAQLRAVLEGPLMPIPENPDALIRRSLVGELAEPQEAASAPTHPVGRPVNA